MTRAQFMADLKHDARKRLYEKRLFFIGIANFRRDQYLLGK